MISPITILQVLAFSLGPLFPMDMANSTPLESPAPTIIIEDDFQI